MKFSCITWCKQIIWHWQYYYFYMLGKKYYLLTLINGIFTKKISQYFPCSIFAKQRDNWIQKACQRKPQVQKVFSQETFHELKFTTIMKKSLSWDFRRLNYSKRDIGKMNFRVRENKKNFKKSYELIITKKCWSNSGICR